MDLSLKFDEKYASQMLDLLPGIQEELEKIEGATEEEVNAKLDQLNEEYHLDTKTIALLVLLLLKEAQEEMWESFQDEHISTTGVAPLPPGEATNKTWETWGDNNIEMVLTLPSLFISNTKAKLLKLTNEYRKTLAGANIQAEVDKRITEFLKEAISQGKIPTEARINFWARDQAGNLLAETSKSFYKENGVKYYLWISRRDGKVRPAHDAKDDGVTLYIVGIGLFPGEDPGCRCKPRMVIV